MFYSIFSGLKPASFWSWTKLAKVDVVQGSENQIQRENAQRRIVVGFNIKNRDVQSIVEELQQKVDKQIKLPPGYSITYGGSFENLNNAKQRLMIAVPLPKPLIGCFRR